MARLAGLALAAAGLSFAPWAAAQSSWDLWSVTGSHTLRAEHYDLGGNRLAGPYQFAGSQVFDEFSLAATRAFSPWDRLRVQLYGVANASDYRSRDTGIVPERLSVLRENGEGAVPYRVEAGDYFANFSYRTLQRSLKGLQVELQPGEGRSLVLLTGVNQPSWRHLQKDDDFSNGASWLMSFGTASRLGANFVHNARQADPAAGTLDRRQSVYSVTGEHAWQAGSQKLRVEGELAGLRGDHDGAFDASGVRLDGQDRRGQGVFAQLTGRDAVLPLDYRLRFERYDRDFRPNGAVILPDRRSLEAFAGWRFAGGLALRGRAQEFLDALESGNRQKTRSFGANLSGPFGAASGIVGQVDVFAQDVTNEAATLDRRSWVATANLGRAIGAGWYGQLGLYHQSVDDRIAGAVDPRTTQVTVNATRAWALGPYAGSVSPGLTWRRSTGDASAVTEATPVLNLSVARGAHSLNASLGRQRLDPRMEGAFDVRTTNARVDYRFVEGRHLFGLEALRYDRETDQPGGATDTWRVALYWTMGFDKPARAVPPVAAAAPVAYAVPLGQDISALLSLVPGSDAESAVRRLRDGGFAAIARQPGLVVAEARLLAEIEERQRLAFVDAAGRIVRAGLVVGFDDAASPQAVARSFERVRKALLDRFGPPASNFEEGAFDAGFVNALGTGRFVRVMEWQAGPGRLRFGIPRRLDGQVRMELQYAPAFGTPRDALWSLEEVR